MRAAVGISRTFFQSFLLSGHRSTKYVHMNISPCRPIFVAAVVGRGIPVVEFSRGPRPRLRYRARRPDCQCHAARSDNLGKPFKRRFTETRYNFITPTLQHSTTPSLQLPGRGCSSLRWWQNPLPRQPRRGGRVVDGSGLENRQGASPRGFESHPLRQLNCGLAIADCGLKASEQRATHRSRPESRRR